MQNTSTPFNIILVVSTLNETRNTSPLSPNFKHIRIGQSNLKYYSNHCTNLKYLHI